MEPRQRILERARAVLAMDRRATVSDFAHAAGVSRASFYRSFKSRDDLLEALSRAPEPDARDRILEAALEMIGAGGLARLSMDQLADRAGVSRATVYRLFPGKAALFAGVVHAYSPLDAVTELMPRIQDQPPSVVMPELARTVYRTIYSGGENRVGLLRALIFEVSGLSPDTEEMARVAIGQVVGMLMLYLVSQMDAGRMRRTNPFLALQAFIGPIFFHLMTRPVAQQVLGVDVDGEQAVTELAELWLEAMTAKEDE